MESFLEFLEKAQSDITDDYLHLKQKQKHHNNDYYKINDPLADTDIYCKTVELIYRLTFSTNFLKKALENLTNQLDPDSLAVLQDKISQSLKDISEITNFLKQELFQDIIQKVDTIFYSNLLTKLAAENWNRQENQPKYYNDFQESWKQRLISFLKEKINNQDLIRLSDNLSKPFQSNNVDLYQAFFETRQINNRHLRAVEDNSDGFRVITSNIVDKDKFGIFVDAGGQTRSEGVFSTYDYGKWINSLYSVYYSYLNDIFCNLKNITKDDLDSITNGRDKFKVMLEAAESFRNKVTLESADEGKKINFFITKANEALEKFDKIGMKLFYHIRTKSTNPDQEIGLEDKDWIIDFGEPLENPPEGVTPNDISNMLPQEFILPNEGHDFIEGQPFEVYMQQNHPASPYYNPELPIIFEDPIFPELPLDPDGNIIEVDSGYFSIMNGVFDSVEKVYEHYPEIVMATGAAGSTYAGSKVGATIQRSLNSLKPLHRSNTVIKPKTISTMSTIRTGYHHQGINYNSFMVGGASGFGGGSARSYVK